MKERDYQGYLIFHSDEHKSEYLADAEERIKFISGFAGSNAYALVTAEKALCWTDSRYYLACERQLEAGWEMMKMEKEVPSYNDWVRDNMNEGDKIAVDARVMGVAGVKLRTTTFSEKGKTLLPQENENLVDMVWGEAKPKRSQDPVWVLDLEFAGESVTDKIERICKQVAEKKADALLVSTLDDVAWTTNMRGADIDCNPLFFAYMLVHVEEKKLQLFIDKTKVQSEKVQEHLKSFNCEVLAYEETFETLKALAGSGKKVGFDPNELNYAMFSSIKDHEPVEIEALIQTMKATKNAAQQQGMIDCHIRDCAALFKYFSWLNQELKKGTEIDEVDGADKLRWFRAQQPRFIYPSFETISSIGPNGADIHYKPEKGSCKLINRDEIYLCDSGGQYLDGTTDITRTTHFGGQAPTAFQKEMFTRVLIGN